MPPAYEVLLLNTAIPQIQAAQSGDTYVVPRDIAFSAALTLSAGTANGVPYLNGSKVVTTGSALTFDGTNLNLGVNGATIYWTAAGNNVAINTSSGVLGFYTGTSSYGLAQQINSDGSTFWRVGGTQAMTLDASGNLGVGITSPFTRLDSASARTTTLNSIASFNTMPASVTDTTAFAVGVGGGINFRARLNSSGYSTLASIWSYRESGITDDYKGSLILGTADNTTGYPNERARIDSSGNLGLGVTPSLWNSGVKSFDLPANASLFSGSFLETSGTWLGNNTYYDVGGGGRFKGTGYALLYNASGNTGSHRWYTSTVSGTANDPIAFTQAMTLDASGNLLVGRTTSDGYRLALLGTTQKTTGLQLTYQGVQAASISVTSTSALAFGVDGTDGSTERARITSGGDFLVATATASASDTSNGTVLSSTGGYIISRRVSGSAQTHIQFVNGGTTVGDISTSTTNTTYATSSDYRLKDNQQPLIGSGAFIDALQPKTWNWKSNGSKGVGFIAHEVQAVSPSTVVGEKDAVDADGKPIMQAMEYGSAEFIANIIAELQSLRARVKALEGA